MKSLKLAKTILLNLFTFWTYAKLTHVFTSSLQTQWYPIRKPGWEAASGWAEPVAAIVNRHSSMCSRDRESTVSPQEPVSKPHRTHTNSNIKSKPPLRMSWGFINKSFPKRQCRMTDPLYKFEDVFSIFLQFSFLSLNNASSPSQRLCFSNIM